LIHRLGVQLRDATLRRITVAGLAGLFTVPLSPERENERYNSASTCADAERRLSHVDFVGGLMRMSYRA
jgi:hypothetical protein